MNQIDPKIIEAVVRPDGVTEAELEDLNPEWRNHLEFLRQQGMHLFEKTIDGHIVYSTVELATMAMPAPAPSTATPPPAEAPRDWGQPDTAPEEADREQPGYNARFTIDTFKVKSREGRPPLIEMSPVGPTGAQVATLFSMQKPKKAIVMVYLKIMEEVSTAAQEPQEPPQAEAPAGPAKQAVSEAPEIADAAAHAEAAEEGGEEDMVQPKDYSTIQINSKGKSNEKQPKAKPKEQIAREISEQIARGELSPAAADAMSKLGGL